MFVAYKEFVDFIAAGTTPESVVAFQPSEAATTRVAELIGRQKSNSLTPDDAAELNHYLHVEHIMRLAKARARRHLAAD